VSAWHDRRLVVVEGKGGVGRTTVTAALALAAGERGRAVAAMELGGEASLAHTFGFVAPRYEPRRITGGVELASLSPATCVVDFAQRKLHLGAIGRWVFDSRPMQTFLDSIPGLPDVLQLGKVENRLSEPADGELPLDLIVLDGPATGHGTTLLASARSLRSASRMGPFHDLAAIIERLLEDRARTATVLVTLPELLPVHETLELLEAQVAEGRVPDLIVVNQHVPPLLTPGLSPHELLATLPDPVHRQIAADRLTAEARQAGALDVLRAGLRRLTPDVPVALLPRLDEPLTSPSALYPLAHVLSQTLAPPSEGRP
jgi:anion-transporting  ArsA/GET3 family ATPase